MPTKVNRLTVDLSQYPRLVVIYLGMRVNRLTGLKTLVGFGPQIAKSAADRPDGLLSHEIAGGCTDLSPFPNARGSSPNSAASISCRTSGITCCHNLQSHRPPL
jgi:hypothetical protein